MFKWVNIIKGFLMGVCELIPGVSSGTMALLLGIYDQFLGAVSKVVSRHYKKAVIFLIPLVIGMGIAILSMSSLIDYLLRNHMMPVHWFFMGLILGVVPMMLRISNYKVEFRAPHYILIIIAVAGLFFMGMMRADEVPIEEISITAPLLIKLFFSGMLGSATMLLPGISGSLVLLLLGSYSIIIYSLSELTSFNFSVLPVLIAAGLGIVAGLLVASRIIQYMLRHYTYLTYALILGLVMGSVFAIYPGLPETLLSWMITVLVFTAGLLISYFMGKENKDTI
ncbi:DUF368 domain-containing protein [Salinicoccus halodurans]|uniref:Membrane protein n=1 Tax=Salinicoccus halodurans TaxID=407035 RepID=A0A0F7HJN7_9STAP|nr:DUF368 domain-containing protein [Salinicoccus halodurans]AKG72951.1 membrane protein [Salinicoccus halodurans]SFK76592.1 putative membrane protein [Salinicoccus halodurans]